jgi:predicted AAA+ superfamily ATPase
VYQRKLAEQIKGRVSEDRRFIQIVVGPRQTGKTTAVIQALESSKIKNHYVSADDPNMASREWLMNEWEQARLLQRKAGGEVLLAVDEIQKVKDWSSAVKLLWDEDTRKKIPIKVILTGSSALLLQKGMAESLMGRYEILYCPHWNFKECHDAFGYSLDEFLFFGGYPGAAALKNDEARWARYIGASIVEPTISQDILMMEEVRKPALLRALFMLGAGYSAQELSYTKILGQLQDAGNTVTLSHYLELLGKANILCGLQKFSRNKIQARQSSPRFLVYDTSLMTYADGTSRRRFLENKDDRGRLTESAVGAYLLARGKEEGFEVYWWRERSHEVDFVIRKGSAVTAVEVKSGRLRKTGGSDEFLKKHPGAFRLIAGGANCGLEEFLSGQYELFTR